MYIYIYIYIYIYMYIYIYTEIYIVCVHSAMWKTLVKTTRLHAIIFIIF